MQECFFGCDFDAGMPTREPKGVFDYIQLTAAERSALRRSSVELENEFKDKHELKVTAYGGVFSSQAAYGYPKPVISGQHLPTRANLHPEKTRRNKDGSAKLLEFCSGQFPPPHWKQVVSDRIKKLIEELESDKYLFFPFDLYDPVCDRDLRYWFLYGLEEEDGIDYVASGYRQSEKTGKWLRQQTPYGNNLVLCGEKLKGRHLVSSPIFSFIYSKEFLDRAGDFLSPAETLVEYRITPAT